MRIAGRVAVVTGGGGGIGAALVARLVDAGAKVLSADISEDRARAAVEDLPPSQVLFRAADVTDSGELAGLLATADRTWGPVDLFFANAGVAAGVDLGTADDVWELSLEVNLMAHVRAARLLVPRWLERGSGYFVSTASAAGLVTQIGSAPYATTKHAAVGFAEWLAVTYGDRGVRVSCVCPMGVQTQMLRTGFGADGNGTDQSPAIRAVRKGGAVLAPDDVARATIAAVEDEQFLVLPHPEVLEFFRRKADDYERWLDGMRRLQRTV